MKDKPKILWMMYRFPYEPVGGDLLLTYKHLEGLAKWADVYLFSLDEFNDATREKSDYLKEKLNLIDVRVVPIRTRLSINLLSSLWKSSVSNRPGQTELYFSVNAYNVFLSYVKNIKPDIIIFQTIRMGKYIEESFNLLKKKNIKVIGFLVDDISLNYKNALNYVKNNIKIYMMYNYEYKKIQSYELLLMTAICDKIIFVSERDANHIKSLFQSNQSNQVVEVVPNGIDVSKFMYKGVNYKSNKIIFVGNMKTVSNDDAAFYFSTQVFDKIKKFIPDIQFWIIGANPSKRLLGLAHNRNDIIVTSRVNNISEYISYGRLAIAPIRFAAGMQNKVLEIAAVGIPQIVSKIVYDGISAFKDGDDILTYNTKDQLIELVFKTWDNKPLLSKISKNGRERVINSYTWENSWEKLHEILYKI